MIMPVTFFRRRKLGSCGMEEVQELENILKSINTEDKIIWIPGEGDHSVQRGTQILQGNLDSARKNWKTIWKIKTS